MASSSRRNVTCARVSRHCRAFLHRRRTCKKGANVNDSNPLKARSKRRPNLSASKPKPASLIATKRVGALAKRNAISKRELDEATNRSEQAAAAVSAAKATVADAELNCRTPRLPARLSYQLNRFSTGDLVSSTSGMLTNVVNKTRCRSFLPLMKNCTN